MFCVCVTGGIASGKSAVTDAFADLGIDISDADIVAREIVAPGSDALKEIQAGFGDSVIAADGALNRSELRKIVFADSAAKKTLEAITHPRIRERMRMLAEQSRSAYCIASVPLWVETSAAAHYAWVSRVLVVSAPREVRLQRLIQRDGIGRELAESMLAQQATDWQRYQAASDIMINDAGIAHLRRCVTELHRHYLQMGNSQ
jgi:dephospho-CoA kinase